MTTAKHRADLDLIETATEVGRDQGISHETYALLLDGESVLRGEIGGEAAEEILRDALDAARRITA